MRHIRWQRIRPWLKPLITIIVLGAIAWRLVPDLETPQLWQRSFDPWWLLACGGLYILGLCCSLGFWYRLLRGLGQRPSVAVATRAYFLGLLGKYVPGKAWALLLRAGLVRGPRARLGVATLTAFYEVLTTMASGVLVAAVLFAVLFPEHADGTHWHLRDYLFRKHPPTEAVPAPHSLLILALILLGVLGVPLIPAVFNRIVRRVSSIARVLKYESAEENAAALPRLRLRFLAEGLPILAALWLLWGLSLWAAFRAMLGGAEAWSITVWLRYTAIVGVSYVSGFVILFLPSGLGVREFLLTVLLVPELGAVVDSDAQAVRAKVLLAVILLRVVWTVAELVVAGAVYFLPGPTPTAMRAELIREGEAT